jgi:hypothetical protein
MIQINTNNTLTTKEIVKFLINISLTSIYKKIILHIKIQHLIFILILFSFYEQKQQLENVYCTI